MLNVFVEEGDIAFAQVEAIVTLINPLGDWYGRVDRVIKRVAGNHYHAVPRSFLMGRGLNDLETIVAYGNHENHEGGFDHVIFVVDALEAPLNMLVTKALETARREGFESIAFPAFRLGAAMGQLEQSEVEVARQVNLALRSFEEGDKDLDVHVVIYNNPELQSLFSAILLSED